MFDVKIGLSFRLVFSVLLYFVVSVLLAGIVMAGDTCITCHTDEEMLIENLGKAEEKKSALQSGPG